MALIIERGQSQAGVEPAATCAHPPVPGARLAGEIGERADALFRRHVSSRYARLDGFMVRWMAAQWVCAAGAVFVLPAVIGVRSFSGTDAGGALAVLLGAMVSLPAILLGLRRPGWSLTRRYAAVAQMLWGALFIHLSGGRLETHLHVFASLAALAFYRDRGLLVIATAVMVIDHVVRGVVWPESVIGIAQREQWRVVAYAGWVLVLDTVLILGIGENLREMRARATRQAEVEALNAGIEENRQDLRDLLERTRAIPFEFSRSKGRIVYVGPQATQLLGHDRDEWSRREFWMAHLHPEDSPELERRWGEALASDTPADVELVFRMRRASGEYIDVRSLCRVDPSDDSVRGFLFDITEQRRLELQLLGAQKLESVGRLASGIAHEINTPIQFVSDSVHYLRSAHEELMPFVGRLMEIREVAQRGPVPVGLLEAASRAEEHADLDYAGEAVPKALERCIEGLDRVATLVRSMKEFAHPDRTEKAPANLNHALSTTLAVARNEYKYVAEVWADLGEVPDVTCRVGQLNQVFLNLIVNAAHAIADVVAGTEKKGAIRVSTRRDGSEAVVTIADTGGGIPDEIADKIFEPFFTTKDVGRGTGQGLAIARSIVVEQHGGTLEFDVRRGVGTTFVIRVPIRPVDAAPEEAAA